MILIDTSIWVDHLRRADPRVIKLMLDRRAVQHPFVTGEVSVGNLADRLQTVRAMQALPQIEPVSEAEFHAFMVANELFGTGLGFVDIQILAAAEASGAQVWTRDQRLHNQAERLGLVVAP